MSVKCPKCQSENPDTQSFCGDCGTQLSLLKDIRAQTRTIETPIQELKRGTIFANRYEIIEELGTGGMGKVYRVEDTKAKEEIALKLIKPEIAADKKTINRFRNELTTARKIRHKNICGMYDLGEYKGSYYITMEYVPGEDLKDLIRRVSIDTRSAIKIAKQICEGLSEAHSLGVIHRDLKPSNIMIDKDGNARIMDFGIARSLKGKGITGEGVMIGTPEYMSPEQVDGKEVDHRSDIYSLGVVLYEMVTGQCPFEGKTALSVARKHADELPKSPKEINPQIPDDLNHLILSCLEKDSEKRFQSVSEVHSVLEDIKKTAESTIVVLPIRKTLSQRIEEIRRKKAFAYGFLILIVLIATTISFIIGRISIDRHEAERIPSVAFLPLSYEGPGLNNYLSQLFPIMLSKRLRSYTDLRVVPYATSHSFGPDADVRIIGHQLSANWVLHGWTRAEGDKIELSLLLSSSDDGKETWTKKIECEAEDIYDHLDTLEMEITSVFNVRQTVGSPSLQYRNLRAYEYYIEGKRFLEGWDIEENYNKAIEAFQSAIQEDKKFPEAHAGLALALWTRYGETNEAKVVERAYQEALKATNLGPDLPEAHLSLGVVQLGMGRSVEAIVSFEKAQDLAPADDAICRRIADANAVLGRNEEAEMMYQRAIELRPNYWGHYNSKASFHMDQGEMELAKQYFGHVIRVRPEGDIGYLNLGAVHILTGDFDKAESVLLVAIQINPTPFAHNNLGFIYYARGKFLEAAEQFDKAIQAGWEDPTPYGNLGDAYRHLGRTDQARKAYSRSIDLCETKLRVNPGLSETRAFFSMNLAGLGRCEEAKIQADQAVSERPDNLNIHYLVSVAYAICRYQDEAVRHMRIAIEGGAKADILTNPDLKPLLKDPDIEKLLR